MNEASILRALTAYKVEGGMDAKTAAAWAQTNIKQGLAKWNEAYGKGSSLDEIQARAAFMALKTWAQAQK